MLERKKKLKFHLKQILRHKKKEKMPLFSDKLNNQGGFRYNIYIIKRDFNQRNVTDLQHAL